MLIKLNKSWLSHRLIIVENDGYISNFRSVNTPSQDQRSCRSTNIIHSYDEYSTLYVGIQYTSNFRPQTFNSLFSEKYFSYTHQIYVRNVLLDNSLLLILSHWSLCPFNFSNQAIPVFTCKDDSITTRPDIEMVVVVWKI